MSRHKHYWKFAGGCLCAGTVEYQRWRCKCGKRKLTCHVGFRKIETIRLKRGETFDQHEVP